MGRESLPIYPLHRQCACANGEYLYNKDLQGIGLVASSVHVGFVAVLVLAGVRLVLPLSILALAILSTLALTILILPLPIASLPTLPLPIQIHLTVHNEPLLTPSIPVPLLRLAVRVPVGTHLVELPRAELLGHPLRRRAVAVDEHRGVLALGAADEAFLCIGCARENE